MLKGKLSHSAMSKASGFAEWLFKVADLQKCLITFFFYSCCDKNAACRRNYKLTANPNKNFEQKYLDKDVSCFSKSQILFTVFHKGNLAHPPGTEIRVLWSGDSDPSRNITVGYFQINYYSSVLLKAEIMEV